MIPSIDTRLASMASAVSGVIGPALASNNSFASEQAALLVGHLQVMRAQQSIAEEFEQLDYNRTRALAAELVANSEGGSGTTDAAEGLRGELNAPVPFHIDDVRSAQDRFAAAIGALIRASGHDGTPESTGAIRRTVIRQEREQSLRFRSFFSMMGYEDGSRPIPSPAEMMTDFRSSYGAKTAGATR